MVEPGDDFDDLHDESRFGPLLPPDDRLWRHPSELGQHGIPVSADALSARRSWMAATPSRAGAWSAGIVGAMLATSVVLVGGHLTHLLSSSTRPPTTPGLQRTVDSESMQSVTTTPTTLLTTTTIASHAASGLSLLASRVASSIPVVLDGNARGAGVVVDSKGYVLVPASLVTRASDISVVIDSRKLVAKLVGVDAGTGLAVVRVHDLDGLTAASFVPDTIGFGAFVGLVWVSGDGTHTCWGTVNELDVRLEATSSSPPLLESLRALGPVTGVPAGGVLIDGAGRLIGMVTSVAGKQLVATPGWLDSVVSRDLITNGRVIHGWLGITGETIALSPKTTTVEVLSVDPAGAAAKAGVKPGDLIEAVNGEPIKSMSDIVAALYSLPPNWAIVIDVVRGGRAWDAHAWLKSAA